MKKSISFTLILVLFISIADLVAGDLELIKERSFKISPGKNLRLETSSGDAVISSWDKDEIYVKVYGNRKAKDKMEFRFRNDENSVEIIAKREGSFFNWFSFSGVRVKFEIKVPSSFNIKVSTSGGDILSSDISGKLDFSTSGGDIRFKNTKGIFDVSTSGGDISGLDFTGNLEASTSGGDIKLNGRDSRIDAETSGGDIYLDYSGENLGINLSTSGGDIEIRLPHDFNASAKLHTSGGDISCNLTANNAKKISSTKFDADLNQGGKRLLAETSGGDITVRKK